MIKQSSRVVKAWTLAMIILVLVWNIRCTYRVMMTLGKALKAV